MTCSRSESFHAAVAQVQAESVEWEPSVPRAHRVRVRAHTCVCESPIFELCAAGGLWFIRRLTGEPPAVIDESLWMSARAGEDLWLRILRGQAR